MDNCFFWYLSKSDTDRIDKMMRGEIPVEVSKPLDFRIRYFDGKEIVIIVYKKSEDAVLPSVEAALYENCGFERKLLCSTDPFDDFFAEWELEDSDGVVYKLITHRHPEPVAVKKSRKPRKKVEKDK